MPYRAICRSADVPESSMKLFKVDHIEVLVGRLHGKLFACDNACPHKGASLAKGDLKGDNVVCWMHGYEYNVFTGRLENMKSWKREETWMEQSPEWRKSGDLILYPVKEDDNTVYVSLS